MVFNEGYAGVYDALYQDKDYEKECDFIEALFRKYNCQPQNILDLGCGTGGHALILAKRGYKVTGIDRSASMLKIARQKAEKEGLNIEFIEGDITKVNIEKKFDAVIAMFAVMSYQTTNSDLASVCKLARESLIPGGLFMFDCWNGFAVLTERPTPRIKEIDADNGGKIIRFTQSELDIVNHIVNVNFRVLKLKGNTFEETRETHKMRFLFPQEIKYFLEVAGFKDIDFYPFLAIDRELTEKDWNMMVVAR